AFSTPAEIRLFLGRGCAAERDIAVWEAPQVLDQRLVLLGELEIAFEHGAPRRGRGAGDLGRSRMSASVSTEPSNQTPSRAAASPGSSAARSNQNPRMPSGSPPTGSHIRRQTVAGSKAPQLRVTSATGRPGGGTRSRRCRA